MKKMAGMEETEITDTKTGKSILVSTTARLYFRKFIDPTNYGKMRNKKLNWIIAKDFADNSSNVLHYFWISKERRVIGEIRKSKYSGYYISAITDNNINIITVQSDYFKSPKYKKSGQIIELGDE